MLLILDFSNSLRLAIVNKDIFLEKELKTKKNISEILIFEIEKFLEKAKIKIKLINSIYVITGPGSFTGIRSALTFAKSLRLTMKVKIYGISKFEILNFQIKSKSIKTKYILLHFKNNQFFMQTFKGNKAVNDARLINLDNEKFKFNSQAIYIYDSILPKTFLEGNVLNKMKENSYLADYNLKEVQKMIENSMIGNINPKPIYVSNYD